MWKIASAGFGLICGVAIIALMNQLNYLFYPVPEGRPEDLAMTYFANPLLLAGKLISIAAGCFFAGAISRLLHPGIEMVYAITIAIVLMILGFADLFTAEYPVWYWVVSLLVYVPASIAGFLFIERIHYQQTEKT
ncbi:MAG: hypothetical protein JJU13_10065 [Balneolaceae bacterium]|nr:hypothetical protein [Balneolaceae bacterium]